MLRRSSPALGRAPLPCFRTRTLNPRFRRVSDRPFKPVHLSSNGEEGCSGFAELRIVPQALRDNVPGRDPDSESDGDGRPDLSQLRSPAVIFRVASWMYLACGALSKDEFRAKLSVYGDPDPILSTQPNHILSELIVWQYWYAYRTIVMRDIVRSPWHQSVPARKYDFLGVPDTLVPFRGGAGGASSDPDAVRDFLVYGGPMGWQEVRILRSPEGAGVKYRSLAFDRLLKTSVFRKYLGNIAKYAGLDWPSESGGDVLLMTEGVASFFLRMLYAKSRKHMGDASCRIRINQVDEMLDRYPENEIPFRLAIYDPALFFESDAIRIVSPEEFLARAGLELKKRGWR